MFLINVASLNDTVEIFKWRGGLTPWGNKVFQSEIFLLSSCWNPMRTRKDKKS